MKSGREQVEIIALFEELGSYRAVAALVGCDHKTVKRYVDLTVDDHLGVLALGAGVAHVVCERGDRTSRAGRLRSPPRQVPSPRGR